MIILGLNQVPGMLGWMHDSAVAIVKNGEIIVTAEEERFNRIRHYRGTPKLALAYCLKEAGITIKEVDIIAIANNPYAPFKRLRISLHPLNFIRDVINILIFEHYKYELKKSTKARVVFVDHHLAHAASTYYCSGFSDATVLTIDGSGETESFAFFVGKQGVLRRIWDIPLGGRLARKKVQSIGGVYSRMTAFLKLGMHGEGKTMGLASYGEAVYDFSKILNIKKHNDFVIDRRNISKIYGHLERVDEKAPLTQEHKNLAASLQKALEDSIVNLAKEAYEYSKIKNFALAGGVALNCNTNTRILLEDFCEQLFLQPAAHDGGIALGAALLLSSQEGYTPIKKINHAYYGPGYSNEVIETLLKNAKLEYEYFEHVEAVTAQYITKGYIVAWFQGRMEMGPRALGNRSILADPTIKGINDTINEQVKHREIWRPFAPSIIEEAAPIYFEGVTKAHESPFMLHTFYVKKEYENTFPAITHVDGSSRIQTVRKDQNERYYNLMKEIEKINGHPIVLDTSLNDKGEPIVCSPYDAVRCFYATGIDVLVIGNYILKKNTVSL
jgi:carbamoyltransferase